MNALADAAFMTAPEGPGYASAAYTDAELRSMGVMGVSQSMMQGSSMLPPSMNPAVIGQPMPPMPSPGSRSMVPSAPLSGPGRHLQILDHTVHRIDAHTKANGEEEKEMVVSNLRHFTLKIGVLDPRMGVGRDAELPLKVRPQSGMHLTVCWQLGTCLGGGRFVVEEYGRVRAEGIARGRGVGGVWWVGRVLGKALAVAGVHWFAIWGWWVGA